MGEGLRGGGGGGEEAGDGRFRILQDRGKLRRYRSWWSKADKCKLTDVANLLWRKLMLESPASQWTLSTSSYKRLTVSLAHRPRPETNNFVHPLSVFFVPSLAFCLFVFLVIYSQVKTMDLLAKMPSLWWTSPAPVDVNPAKSKR